MVARPKPRTSLIAGVFVIVGLLGAIAIGFTLTDTLKLLDSTRGYTVRFGLDDGVSGVKRGSPVTLGGYEVGRVVDLRPADEPASGVADGRTARVPTAMLVDIRLPADMALYGNAVVRVQRPLIGTLSAINIVDPGGPGREQGRGQGRGQGDESRGVATAPLDAGATIAGASGGSIDAIIDNASELTGSLQTILAALAPRAETGSADLAGALEAMRSFTERIDRRSAPLLDDLEAAVTRTREVGDRLSGMVDSAEAALTDARGGIGEIRGLIENADGFVADTRALIDETGPDLRDTASNAADLAERLNTRIVPEYESRFGSLLDRGDDVLGSADAMIDELNTSFRELEPQIRRTAANLRLGSDTALAFVDEVRAAPWRLLNRPGKREQQRDLLYSAARNYARAVSDLRATSASLESAVAGLSDGASPTEPRRIIELRAELTAAFDRYAKLESDLLDLLAGEGLDDARLPAPATAPDADTDQDRNAPAPDGTDPGQRD